MSQHPARLILWGASGHGKVILDVAKAMDIFNEIVFIDDAHDGVGRQHSGHDVIAVADCLRTVTDADRFLISIGRNEIRAVRFQDALDRGLRPATLLHPSAVISSSASVGSGTVVMARAVINASAEIGCNCIVNTAAVIEHDCRIGDHAHISPGALLAGGVTVGSYTHLGIGAAVLPGVQIGHRVTVGAGAVVTKSVPDGITVVGIPARQFRTR